MGVWLGPMGNGSGPINKKKDINYTGNFDFYINNDTGDWEIRLTTSGTLKFKKNPDNIDVFLVGYGDSGSSGGGSENQAVGGSGGYGGQCINRTFTNISKNIEYLVDIGSKSEDKDTSIFNLTAYGGGKIINGNPVGYRGSTGATAYMTSQSKTTAPAPGPNTTYGAASGVQAFNTNTSYFGGSHYFGSGGGGGGAGYYTGSYGATGNYSQGGDTYAGVGGAAQVSSERVVNKGEDATQNTGSGGGGGAAITTGYNTFTVNNGGAGSNGVIIIRNNRGTTFS